MQGEAEITDTTLEERPSSSDERALSSLGIVWISASGSTRTTLLQGERTLIVGRTQECHVVLAGRLVSRHHARLSRNAGCWFVEDLGSRNGVRLDGRQVGTAPLVEGSVLRLGSWIGIVRKVEAGASLRFGELGHGLVGGPELEQALRWVSVAAESGMSVVIEGETGTGKELFARAIHERSARSGPFLAMNCAVYQPATAAAELFGYRRGAFTGAVDGHVGLLRGAQGGTLFLDEVQDLSLEIQAQLLRAIEQREVIPFGEARASDIDVRFVAATQRSLARCVAEGRFRADLQARLEGIRIELPSLARRVGDAPLLFLHFVRSLSATPPLFDARVLEWLSLRAWPLNVRELLTFARRVLAAYPGAQEISLQQAKALVPAEPSGGSEAPQHEPASSVRRSDSAARPRRTRLDPRAFGPETVEAFRAALARNSGNVAKAAAELEISRQRAYRILRLCTKPDA